MNVAWLFEIATERWATDAGSYLGNDYIASIVANSFTGMTIPRLSVQQNGITPINLTFKVLNTNDYPVTYIGQDLTVRLMVDGTQRKIWKFKIKTATESYNVTTFQVKDILTSALDGQWPFTTLASEYPEQAGTFPDNVCIPVVFGSAYIPLTSISKNGTQRPYILGSDNYIYVVEEVQSPTKWRTKSTWTATEYTFVTTSVGTHADGLLAYIADSNNDNEADAHGLWLSGQQFLPMPTKYTSTEINDTPDVDPAEVIEFFLKEIGINTTDIDTGTGSTFEAATAQYASWGLAWNGGWYESQTREAVLANMLMQCNSTLIVTDKIELHPISDTPIYPYFHPNEIKRESFKEQMVFVGQNDGGYLNVLYDEDTPQDQKTKIIAGTYNTENLASTVLDFSFLHSNFCMCGLSFYQRKYGIKTKISFTAMPDLTWLLLKPDDMIRVMANSLYGATTDVDMIIDSMKINKDLSINFDCLELHTTYDHQWDECDSTIPTPIAQESYTIPEVAITSLIGAKKNIVDFSTASDGYVYIHGFDEDGVAADVNGYVSYNGEMIFVPRVESGVNWTIKTSQTANGYIVFDTTVSEKFTVASTAHSLVFAQKVDDQWQYDDGSAWVDFTPALTDTIIGSLTM